MTTEQFDFLPVLSVGRHRSARRGACFMEYASYLAGQRWSDHPECTHPTLAALARLVNDLTSDGERSQLAPHIPSVVGLIGDDPRIPVIVSTIAAAAALPVASQTRQRALAAALVRCERLLDQWSGPEIDRARLRIRVAFMMTPGTEGWALDFLALTSLHISRPAELADDAVLRTAVIGIADACIPDADARLARVLGHAIDECRLILAAQTELVETPVSTAKVTVSA
jgi:hypothetical protein